MIPSRSRLSRTKNLSLFAALATLIVSAASAQTPAPAAAADEAKDEVKMDKFVVTGSYIPLSADAPPAPVLSVSVADIQASGVSSDLLEVVRKTTPQFVGNGNLGSTNSNIAGGSTNGGSQAMLRNTNTLVLINGRRAAFAPVSATGGYTFVDMNAIPVSAVEKVEILSDGASAIYGSDAVSGVVNIILKKNYNGFEVSSGYKFSKTLGDLVQNGPYFQIKDKSGNISNYTGSLLPNGTLQDGADLSNVYDANGKRQAQEYSLVRGEDGTWEERFFNVFGGVAKNGTSVSVSAEWVKSDPQRQTARDVSSMTFGTPTFPGVVQVGGTTSGRYFILNPKLNAPDATSKKTIQQLVDAGVYQGNPLRKTDDATTSFDERGYTYDEILGVFNLASAVTLNMGNEKKAFTVNLDQKLTDSISAFGDVLYANTKTDYQINAQPLTNVTLQTYSSSSTAAAQADSPFTTTVRARNRLVDNPRIYTNDTDSARFVAGLRGDITEDIGWEVAANYNTVTQDYINLNVIDRAGIIGSKNAGALNMFAYKQDASALASGVFGVATAKNESTLLGFDGRVTGRLPWELPSGKIGFAVGLESRKETLDGTPDEGSYDDGSGQPTKWDGATTSDLFSASRNIKSAFTQISVPVFGKKQAIPGLYNLEVNAAVRYDRYSDTQDPVVPKYELRWQPIDEQLTLRTTVSRSFTAPSLYNLFGPAGVGYTDEITDFDSVNGTTYPTLGQFDYRTTGNKALKPERSHNFTAGFVYSPKFAKGLNIEFSYFRLHQTDIISRIAAQDILQDVELNGANSIYSKGDPTVGYVSFDGFNSGLYATAPGQITWDGPVTPPGDEGLPYVTNPLVNLSSAVQDGYDITIGYSKNVGSLGKLSMKVAGLYYNSYTVNDNETVGYTTATNGTIPQYLLNSVVTFERGNWTLGSSVQFVPSVQVKSAIPDFMLTVDKSDDRALTDLEFDKMHVGSYASFDFFGEYRFSGLSGKVGKIFGGLAVRAGVNNAFDHRPPQEGINFSDANYDAATYGTKGRVYYIEARYKF